MTSVLIYNVENNKNKEKSLYKKVYPNFWLVLSLEIFNLLNLTTFAIEEDLNSNTPNVWMQIQIYALVDVTKMLKVKH